MSTALELVAAAPELTSIDVERIAAAVKDSTAPATRRQYRSHLRRFAAWLDRRGATATDATIAAYLAEREAAGAALATLRMDSAAIGAAAKVAGQADPRGPITRQALKGFARRPAAGRGQVDGIGRSEAAAAAGIAAATGTVAGARDAAMILLAADALLRISELAAVRPADLAYAQDGSGTLHIPRSKTDQEGEGETVYVTRSTVAALRRWQEAAIEAWNGSGEYGDGPVFRRVTRSGRVIGDRPLTPNAVRSILQRRAAAAGIEGRISGHSLRVGSAQSLVRRGASTAELQQAGRWKDPRTATRYAARELAGRGAVARYFEDGGK